MTDEQDKDESGRIVISAESKGAVTITELPFRILVIGDFTPEAPKVDNWEESSRLIDINSRNFQAVMGQLSPSLSLEVFNKLGDSPEKLNLQLHFSNIQAFNPGQMAQQIPELGSLLSVRRLAGKLKEGELTFQEFEEQLIQANMEASWIEGFRALLSGSQAPTASTTDAPARKPDGDVLDSLLSMVDTSDKKTTGVGGSQEAKHIDTLLNAIASSGKSGPKIDKSVIENFINELDNTLSSQISEILHHEKFQQLESAWRGLKFLVDRTDFQANIKMEILSAHKNELREAIYNQVFNPEYNGLSATPLSLMIGDYEFNSSPEDVELLWDIARISSGINVPFISSVEPEFFGVQTAGEISRLPLLSGYMQKQEYTQWNEFRGDEESQYIAIVLSRFLLRYPYGPDTIQVKEFNFVEQIRNSRDYLWGRGAFALGGAIVRSFAQDGWCVNITGSQSVIDNLPIRSYRVAAREVSIPLEVLFVNTKEKEFHGAGFILLSCRINDNRAYILSAPTIHRPQQHTTAEENMEAYLHASLPYQLFASRMSHYLQKITKEVSTGMSPEQIQIEFTGKLRSIFAKPDVQLSPDAVLVEVSRNKEAPGVCEVFLRIRPPFQILGQDVDLLLGSQFRY